MAGLLSRHIKNVHDANQLFRVIKNGLRERNPELLMNNKPSEPYTANVIAIGELLFRTIQIFSPRPCQYASRNSRLSVLPAALRGKACMITTSLTRW